MRRRPSDRIEHVKPVGVLPVTGTDQSRDRERPRETCYWPAFTWNEPFEMIKLISISLQYKCAKLRRNAWLFNHRKWICKYANNHSISFFQRKQSLVCVLLPCVLYTDLHWINSPQLHAERTIAYGNYNEIEWHYGLRQIFRKTRICNKYYFLNNSLSIFYYKT